MKTSEEWAIQFGMTEDRILMIQEDVLETVVAKLKNEASLVVIENPGADAARIASMVLNHSCEVIKKLRRGS